ncbi:hypothetical protein AC579_569 [Pseudocercospora musae]|uniref:Uncharacterized protein n=1 Tax=Pseudocercospora musae TaxID=113226 RepID=A0A139H527_9PEZI|nr:hypothetical protein AC579_569 [Pseudocercospora musae]KXS97545.1 hypothetical protein AC579_569 [Pseudocercospora musae]
MASFLFPTENIAISLTEQVCFSLQLSRLSVCDCLIHISGLFHLTPSHPSTNQLRLQLNLPLRHLPPTLHICSRNQPIRQDKHHILSNSTLTPQSIPKPHATPPALNQTPLLKPILKSQNQKMQ